MFYLFYYINTVLYCTLLYCILHIFTSSAQGKQKSFQRINFSHRRSEQTANAKDTETDNSMVLAQMSKSNSRTFQGPSKTIQMIFKENYINTKQHFYKHN